MNSARKERNKFISFSLLFNFTRRTILFLFLFQIFAVLIFIIGNYQNFLDSTQNIIIVTAQCTSAALMFICFAGCVEAAILGIRHTEKLLSYVLTFILFLVIGFSSFFSQLIFASITVFSSGL